MAKLKNIDGIEITFKRRIRMPLFFVYEVELINTSDNKAKYDLRYMVCNAGANALLITPVVNGYELLADGELKSGELVSGYIAFIKGDTATNQPQFYWMGGKTKVKDKELM
jgi:hypothetical protein